jgi:hypothetical protein
MMALDSARVSLTCLRRSQGEQPHAAAVYAVNRAAKWGSRSVQGYSFPCDRAIRCACHVRDASAKPTVSPLMIPLVY